MATKGKRKANDDIEYETPPAEAAAMRKVAGFLYEGYGVHWRKSDDAARELVEIYKNPPSPYIKKAALKMLKSLELSRS